MKLVEDLSFSNLDALISVQYDYAAKLSNSLKFKRRNTERLLRFQCLFLHFIIRPQKASVEKAILKLLKKIHKVILNDCRNQSDFKWMVLLFNLLYGDDSCGVFHEFDFYFQWLDLLCQACLVGQVSLDYLTNILEHVIF